MLVFWNFELRIAKVVPVGSIRSAEHPYTDWKQTWLPALTMHTSLCHVRHVCSIGGSHRGYHRSRKGNFAWILDTAGRKFLWTIFSGWCVDESLLGIHYKIRARNWEELELSKKALKCACVRRHPSKRRHSKLQHEAKWKDAWPVTCDIPPTDKFQKCCYPGL